MLVEGPLDSAARLRDLQSTFPEAGGLVCFSGQVRGGAEADPVRALFLEHHPELTWSGIETEIEKIRAEIDVYALEAWHRIGLIPVGETIVHVAAASRHRRAAFLAVDRLMDYLKTGAIFWKREDRQSGSNWIEPRGVDYEDAKRWQNLG